MKNRGLTKKGNLLKRRGRFGLNMTFYFSLIIISEILLSIGIASGLTYAFDGWFNLFDYMQPSVSILIVGTVVATGTPEEVARVPASYTGQFLKGKL